MTKKKPKQKRGPDMEGSMAALIRASKRARELAARTGTAIVVMRDGKLVREIPTLDSETGEVQEIWRTEKTRINRVGEGEAQSSTDD